MNRPRRWRFRWASIIAQAINLACWAGIIHVVRIFL